MRPSPISALWRASSASGCTWDRWACWSATADRQPLAPVLAHRTVEARFDKIHMFDVQLPGGEVYRESKNYQPGDAAVLAELPWGTLG